MNYNEIFDKYELNEKKLITYGFKLKNNKYFLIKELDDTLTVEFLITLKTFDIKVFDKETNEEFIPFTIKTSSGKYVSKIREKVGILKEEILNLCFIKDNLKDQILEYLKKKENTTISYPWKKTPEYCTIKVNDKWYGLIMDISSKLLGLDNDTTIDVINLKNKQEIIDKLIDNKNYFRAYHMNKKYWYTVILNKNITFDKIKILIDESYNEVLSK